MRKGISEIISSVLLLAIAVSVAGVYSQWAPDFAESASETAGTQAENQIKCSNAAFDISEISYDRTGQITEFNISNKGTINFENDITITSVNSSQIVGQKTIKQLEVEETQQVELQSDKIPELLVASSQECPELRVSEENINVQK